jgi:hypothetical protein
MLGIVEELQHVDKDTGSRAPVAHSCNPSYSGGRDQENNNKVLKPANANSW